MLSTTQLIYLVIMGAILVFFAGPRVLRLNRGKILENIAIWLAIFIALCWLYQNFGPEARGGKPFFFSELWNKYEPIVEDKQNTDGPVKVPENAPFLPKIEQKPSKRPDLGSI